MAAAVDFSNRSDFAETPSGDGAVTLKWEQPPGTDVELQQAAERSFTEPVNRYSGPDPGSVLTGLPEGTHYFRIRGEGGRWSPPLEVKVEFFPRGKLILLLAAGGLVVTATVGAILVGAAKTGREGRAR